MHIALLTSGISPYVIGGLQRHSAMLAKYLPKTGCSLSVFHTAFTRNAETVAREAGSFKGLAAHKTDFEFVEYPKQGRIPGHYVRDQKAYSELLLKRYLELNVKADFIYAQGLTGYAFVEAKRGGMELPPIGVNQHGYEMFQRAPDLRRRAEQLMLRPTFRQLARSADLVFSFSGAIRNIVETRLGVPAEHIIEVPNGVESTWLKQDRINVHKPRKLVFIGRWERRKGVEELTRALMRIKEKTFEIHFIGPIPQANQIDFSNFFYHGGISEPEKIREILDHCDALICPSYAEGMPTVILEAMARGLAILATDVGAIREIVSDKNGLLMSAASVDEIESALLEFLFWNDATLLSKRNTSRIIVESYTWNQVAKRTFDVMRAIVS